MKRYIKLFLIVVLLTVSALGTYIAVRNMNNSAETREVSKEEAGFDPFTKIDEYKRIINERNLNIQYVFVVDYSIHSGKKRFYVLDILNNRLDRKMMVSHGARSETKPGYATDFSNVPESNKSSLGYAIVNGRAYSNWGIHVKYWLDGISPTNSNMRRRIMVMHSYVAVPSIETYPSPIITSLGCVMLSDKDMRYIDELMKRQNNKRVLMHIRA